MLVTLLLAACGGSEPQPEAATSGSTAEQATISSATESAVSRSTTTAAATPADAGAATVTSSAPARELEVVTVQNPVLVQAARGLITPKFFYVVDVSTDGPSTIHRVTDEFVGVGEPSPDGTRALIITADETRRLLLLDFATGETENLTEITDADVLEDIGEFAWLDDTRVLGTTSGARAYLVDLAARSVEQVDLPLYFGSVDAAPDGATLLVSVSIFEVERGMAGLYTTSLDSLELTPWLLDRDVGGRPTLGRWSPDGDRVAVQITDVPVGDVTSDPDAVSTERHADVFVADADGNLLTRITESDGVFEGYPDWSPSGEFLAFEGGSLSFSAESGTGSTGAQMLWVAASDGSLIQETEFEAGDIRTLRWLPGPLEFGVEEADTEGPVDR